MTPTEIDKDAVDLLRHATAWPRRYRNHFVTGDDTHDFMVCQRLCEVGLMRDRGRQDFFGGQYLFCVTAAGHKLLEELETGNCANNSTMPEKVYLVIWAGYVHCGVFTTHELADGYIEASLAKPDAWGIYRVEELSLNPGCADGDEP